MHFVGRAAGISKCTAGRCCRLGTTFQPITLDSSRTFNLDIATFHSKSLGSLNAYTTRAIFTKSARLAYGFPK
jgi:hypothetical protein